MSTPKKAIFWKVLESIPDIPIMVDISGSLWIIIALFTNNLITLFWEEKIEVLMVELFLSNSVFKVNSIPYNFDETKFEIIAKTISLNVPRRLMSHEPLP